MFSNFHNATDFEVYVFIKNTKIHYLEKKKHYFLNKIRSLYISKGYIMVKK